MPLKRRSSRKVISENIKELMHTYQREGRIGASRPAGKGQAARQAAAIATRKARETGREPGR